MVRSDELSTQRAEHQQALIFALNLGAPLEMVLRLEDGTDVVRRVVFSRDSSGLYQLTNTVEFELQTGGDVSCFLLRTNPGAYEHHFELHIETQLLHVGDVITIDSADVRIKRGQIGR